MVAAEAAHLALDAALLVRPLDPRPRERRGVQVVRAQRDEAVALDPAAALQDPLHRRGQVVVADLREHAAEPLERLDVQLEERLLRLDQRGLTERRPRKRRAHEEQMNRRAHPRQVDLGDLSASGELVFVFGVGWHTTHLVGTSHPGPYRTALLARRAG